MPKKIPTITQAKLVELVAEETGFAKVNVRDALNSLRSTIIDLLTSGNKVAITGLVRFEPHHVAEKKKGELVRNPATGETQPRAKSEPASFRAKAYASPAIKKEFPSVKSAAGQSLEKALKKPAKKKK